jgi:23S rRNA (guanine745-N1)-methyltransferase
VIDAVLDLLRCPRCAARFEIHGRTLRCAGGHVFDVARQGYVNLIGSGQPMHADSSAMVSARAELLDSGRYAALAGGLVAVVPADVGTVIDVGSGTGHYAAAALEARPGARGLGIDLSVAACRRAARAHSRLGVAAADAWRVLPVADGCADVVLSVFSPRNAGEFVRVLRPGGTVITVIPRHDHLIELRDALGLLGVEADKETRLGDAFRRAGLRPVEHRLVESRALWQPDDAVRSVMMGPNAFHTTTDEVRAAASRLPWPQPVTVACQIIRWTR